MPLSDKHHTKKDAKLFLKVETDHVSNNFNNTLQEAPLSESPAKKEGAADAAAPDGKVPSNGHSNGEEKTEDEKVSARKSLL